jgi:TRAP-type mannitol/chloroaromatic compound transport system permease small subunit
MKPHRILHFIDRVSEVSGKTFAWLIVGLALVVAVEVFKRYILNAPTRWIYDLNNMLYGTLFMMCGAYALAQNAHVRGDFLYGSMKPRTQAALDLTLYILFFIPGILALIYAGWYFAEISWRINEHSNVTADGPPVYQFKTFIPIAGALVMLQGLGEIARCILCLRTGQWPERLKDVEEIDVVGEQLAHSAYVDEESRRSAAEQAQHIHEAAHQRGLGDSAKKDAQ